MNILFIGLGSIGQRHLRNIKSIYPNFKFFAYRVKNRNFEIKDNKKYQKKNLIKNFNITIIKKLNKESLKKINVGFICNPTSEHIKFSTILAKNKINLFIEKPISNNERGLKKLNQIIKKNNLYCLVGYNLRFHVIYKKIKEMINKNYFGKIYFAEFYNGEYLPDYHLYENYKKTYMAQKKLGGGVLLTQIHEIDMIIDFFGIPKKIESIVAKISDLKIDVEDVVKSIMLSKKNTIIHLHLDYITKPPQRYVRINGSKNSIIWNYYNNSLEYFDKRRVLKKKFKARFDRNAMFREEIKFFFKNLNQKKLNNLDLNNAKKSLDLVLRIKKNEKKKNTNFFI